MTGRPVALVTGGSRGIGRAMCIDLARHGFDVVPTARSLSTSAEAWPGTVEETAARVRAHGGRALPLRLDLRSQDDVRAAVDATLTELGRIDVVITNATHIDFSDGGTYLSPFVDTRWEALEEHVAVNVTSTLLLLRLVLPGMVERGSGIVMNVTQNCSWLSLPDLPQPGAGMCGMAIPVTRGVTDRLAPALQREVAPHGVTVLTFDPGLTLSISDARYADTGRAGFIPEAAHSVCVPARAATYLATCPNPSAFNGAFVIAEDLVRSCGLLTEAQIAGDWHEGVADVEQLPPLPGWTSHAANRAVTDGDDGRPGQATAVPPVGLTHQVAWEVKPEHVPGHVPASVLSTPSLVAFIEGTCRRGVLPHLDPGHETVGAHVCVSHEGTAQVGETVEVAVTVVAVERRRLTFEVHVRGPRGDVSRGTHQRVVVDTRRFG